MKTMIKRQYPTKNGELHWSLDRIGMRFGKLLVVRFDSFGDREPIWLCRCDCGTEKVIPTQGLRTGRTRSCGCLSLKALGRGPGDGAAHTLYMQYKARAKFKKMGFDLTEEQFKEITQKNCHYCGLPPSSSYRNNYATSYVYNGIDRYDNTKGYIVGNCAPCCDDCNKAKKDQTVEQFEAYRKRLAEHGPIRPLPTA